MKALLLKAKKREATRKKVTSLRENGIVPAVLYGHKVNNVNLQVPMNDFIKIYREAGESMLFDLAINDDKPLKVIIKDVQRDPVRGDFLHIDFHQVSMHEKIQAQIPLKFIGIAPAVKIFGGVFITQKEILNVKCLPQDLVSEIEVDISSIVNLEDTIKIKDIKVLNKIEILDNLQEIVASVIVTKEEVVEVKPAATAGEAPVAASGEKKEEKTGEATEQKPQGGEKKQEQKKPDAKK